MIKQKTARAMLYDWHGGQWSATYAAASSGLVEDQNALLSELTTISFQDDRNKITEWLLKQIKLNNRAEIFGTDYLMLPWADR